MSEADAVARWVALHLHADEIAKAEDEPRKQHHEARKAWLDKIAEMKSAADTDLPRLTAESAALARGVSEADVRLDNALAASQAARKLAEDARPLSAQQFELDGKLLLARRAGRAPPGSSSGTPQ